MDNHGPEVTKFLEYLRIRTDHPNPAYDKCRVWLLDYIAEVGLELVVDKEYEPGYPVIVARLQGACPQLPTLLINSHMDVAPAENEHWTLDPFGGHVTEDGKVFGRGSQDMKCVGIQHLELLRRIKKGGKKLQRTIYISFVPDEEPLGSLGMNLFCKSDDFTALNIGVVLDEGLAREDEAMNVYYGERHLLWAAITFTGNTGHGSMFIGDTAVAKMVKFLQRVLEYRDEQENKQSECVTVSEVNTLNIGMIQGGVQPNVVPSELKVTIDCRIKHEEDFEEFKDMLHMWVEQAGGGHVDIINQSNNEKASSTEASDKWWSAIVGACDKHSVELVPQIFPANTDSRFLRSLGLPAYGFSPINKTPVLLHDHDEFLGVQTFLRGIQILQEVVERVANVPQ